MRHLDIVPVLKDNYVYLLPLPDRQAIAVDPGEAHAVQEHLNAEGRVLHSILITHHHADHTGGNAALKARYGCKIIGPDDGRIPGLDQVVGGGDSFAVGPYAIRVIATPGHTTGHVCYYLPNEGVLFSGDTLFLGGCGRLFEGTAETMWRSLQLLMELPDATLVYAGHEYTESNLRFAASIETANAAIQERLRRVKGRCSMPGNLGEEKRTNPFLRAVDPDFQEQIGMKGADPVEVFARLRSMKDDF